MDVFLRGLSKELRSFIFQLETLDQTIDPGRKHILTMEALAKRLKLAAKPFSNSLQGFRRANLVFNSSLPPLNSP